MSVSARTPWVVGNWKMNPTWAEAQQLLLEMQHALLANPFPTTDCNLAVAPTSIHLLAVQQQLASLSLPVASYAQNVSCFSGCGAYTGEVSAHLLADAQVKGVLIGHSERREWLKEDAQMMRQKMKQALNNGLQVIYCVGESLQQREQGLAQQVVSQQLCDIATEVSVTQWQQVVVAYEPVWAIGTGKTASPHDAQSMHAHIRNVLKQIEASAKNCIILYGGSVKPENAVELAACPDIDGALVGGASLNANSFLQIASAFAKVKAVGV